MLKSLQVKTLPPLIEQPATGGLMVQTSVGVPVLGRVSETSTGVAAALPVLLMTMSKPMTAPAEAGPLGSPSW
jgi:hypothetical protein